MVVTSRSSWSGWPTTCFFAELTRLRITPTISKHQCRGSSLVERRPEKAGVASSILAPGTTHAYHGLFAEEDHFAPRSITKGSVLSDRCEGQFSELFRHHSPSLMNALRMRNQLSEICKTLCSELSQFIESSS